MTMLKDEYSKRLSNMKIGGMTPKQHFDAVLTRLDKELKAIEENIGIELDKNKQPEKKVEISKQLKAANDREEGESESESETESENGSEDED